MKFSNEEWRAISISLRAIYRGIFEGFNSPEQRVVLSLVDAGEDVLAMEEMSACLLASGRLCPPEVLPNFRALAEAGQLSGETAVKSIADVYDIEDVAAELALIARERAAAPAP